MISPVKNISFKSSILATKKPQKNSQIPEKREVFQQYPNNNINFAHYMYSPLKIDFDTTIDRNYFQLPKITLKNGEKYQLQPDENQTQAARELYRGNNLLYVVPTGSGKTAVAHWAITKNINEHKKSIYTVPTKALANDKYDEFCETYGEKNVGILTGDKKENAHAPVVIMTTEIYDKQVQSDTLNSSNTGTVIYDEAHYIADEDRGCAWENSIIESTQRNIQTLLLSATVANSEEYRRWIGSLNPYTETKIVETEAQDRFVPQMYYSYFGGEFSPLISGKINLDEYFSEKQKRGIETLFRLQNNKELNYKLSQKDYQKTLAQLKENAFVDGYKTDSMTFDELNATFNKHYKFLTKDEKNSITQLLLDPNNKKIKSFHNPHTESDYPELISKMNNENMLPAIVYRLSKRKCEDTSNDLANSEILDLTTEEEKQEIEQIIDKYQQENKYLGLFSQHDKEKLIKGIGTHHSAKAPEYKALVEELFRKKLLKVVVATSTLGIGIDMPAKSTVVSDITYRKIDPTTQETKYEPVSKNEFWQMVGRAGRRGQDPIGNVIIYNPSSNEGKAPKGAVDEEALIQEYLISGSNNLTSSFKPSLSGLAQYYNENTDPNGLVDVIEKSFKVFLSDDPEKETEDLIKEFKKCTNFLLKQGYLYKNNNEIFATPKGKILSLSKSSNPQLLATMLYDESLKDASVEQLCQIAGYIAGSQTTIDKRQNEEFEKLLAKRIHEIEDRYSTEETSPYSTAKTILDTKENSIYDGIENFNVDFEGKSYTDKLSGYTAYCWSLLNQHSQNSIKNFDEIMTFETENEKESLKNTYKNLSTAGDNYKLISQSISILKQMDYICDFAIANEDDFPNTQYWTNLKAKISNAIKSMNKPPITDFVEKETPAYTQIKKLNITTCPVCNEPMTDKYKAKKYATRMLYLRGQEAYNHIENGIKDGFLYPMAKNNKTPNKLAFNPTANEALRKIQQMTLKFPEKDVKEIIKMLSDEYEDEIKIDRLSVLEEMENLIKESGQNEETKNELYDILENATNEILDQTTEEFQNRKFIYKIKRVFINNQNNSDLYDKLIEKAENLPSSKNDLGAFFVRFNSQPTDRLVSAFANPKTSTVMEINYQKEKSNDPSNYIKTCTSCEEDRNGEDFSEWSKNIPHFKTNMQNYLNSISELEEVPQHYIEGIKEKI